ncbi:MAG: hypothetical protein C0498_10435, partial [Anaerolinea sp.]|nr:hypothetical protein [Anaerolinea sp.]
MASTFPVTAPANVRADPPADPAVTRVSVSSAGTEGDSASLRPSISGDGRYVAFSSQAANFVPGDTSVEDIFVRDRSTGLTARVSVSTTGEPGDSYSYDPSISADGRYVAFTSDATNLVPGDTNARPDVFVHDRTTGATTRVSVTSAGGQAVLGGLFGSSSPAISADGRYVAFSSSMSDLVSGDGNAAADVFVHDRATGETTIVSVSTAGLAGNSWSFGPAISADGRFVAFTSDAGDLVPDDGNGQTDVFVRDRTTGTTERVSVDSSGGEASGWSAEPTISGDGGLVAFRSSAADLVGGDTNGVDDIFVRDRAGGLTTRISPDSTIPFSTVAGPAISADGRFVAFAQGPEVIGGRPQPLTQGADYVQILVAELANGQVKVASVTPTGTPAGGASSSPAISADGHFVAFDSYASDLVANDTNGSPDVFVRDTATPVAPPPPPVEPAPSGTIELENGGTLGDPVQTFSGAFTYSFTDVAIPGRGPTPSFTRSYNSADTRTGPLGPGWTHGYNARLRNPGDGSGDLLFVRPDGNTDRFIFNPDGSFSPSPATSATLVQNPDETYVVTEKSGFRWSFDSAGSLTALTDRYGNRSTLGYDGTGQLTSIADPAGRGSLALGYTNGLLTSVSDWATLPRTVTYGYDASGRLSTVTDREGQTTTFAYDGTSSRLTTITDARGNVALTLTYDAQGRVQTQRDARGLVTGQATTFAYVVNPDGTRETTVTSPPTSFEPSFSPTATDSYNAQGWLTSRVARPSSTETLTETYGYEANGFRSTVTDPRGTTTDLCYDVDSAGVPIAGSRGNLTRRIDPAPTPGGDRPVTLFSYDAFDNVTQTVSPRGVASSATTTCLTDLSGSINTQYATDMAYDAAGATLLSTTTRFTDPELGPQTAVTTFEYADSANPGRITRTVPPRGNTGPSPDPSYATTMTYAATGPQAGMLVGATDALGNTITYEYDPVGRQTKVVDPLGNAAGGVPGEHTTEYVYDNEDRVRFVTLPPPTAGGSPLVSETRYDEVGNRTVGIDANGQVTTYAYDERDGLVQVQESPLVWTDPAVPPPAVITTEYAYDAAGNLARMIRAKGDAAAERVTDYAYDGRGLVRRETQYPSWPSTAPTLVTASSYDPNGNLTTVVDPLGRTTTSTYDALNRLAAVDYSDPATPDVTYAYDASGNRTSMVDGTGATAYAYDEAGRLISVTTPGPVTVAYRYDLDGNRTRLIYPDATAVTYAFDKASRLASLADWAGRTVGYTYFPDGALKDVTNPNGTVSTYAYDNARRATSILHQQGATTIGQYAYTLDAVGNVTGLQDGAQPTSYGLDRLYRLTSVAGPDGNRTYGYDPAGNRTSLVAGGTTTYVYDRADRIVSLEGPPVPNTSTRPPASHNSGWTNSARAYTSNNSY